MYMNRNIRYDRIPVQKSHLPKIGSVMYSFTSRPTSIGIRTP